MDKKKIKFSVTWELILGIAAVGLIICVAASFIGYREFTSVFEQKYNDTAYNIAYTVQTLVSGDKVEEYLKTGKKDEDYAVTEERLDILLDKMKANYIYVAAVDTSDYETLTYVFDAYNPVMNPEPYELGYVSKDVNSNYRGILKSVMETGKRPDSYLYSYNPKFGPHTSAIVPVYNSKKEAVAYIGVEMSLSAIVAARKTYVFHVLLVTLIIVFLFMAGDMFVLNRHLVRPIILMTKEADEFVKNKDELAISNALGEIKSKTEIGVLADSIVQMEKNIQEYVKNLTEVTAEKERIGAELNVATQIQADMLPSIFPPYPDRNEFDLYATMDPAKEVGGDFYDFFMTDDDHLAVVIGDVSGKGVPAALFMVISKTLIKNYASVGMSVDEVFTRTNNDLCVGNEAQLFTTAWIGFYEISSGKLVFADAGHEIPLRLKPDGTVDYLKPVKKKMVLAAMENIKYVVTESYLDPGDMLLIYTDGVPEATNAHEELYGMGRLENIVKQHRGGDPHKFLQEIRADVDKFVGDAPQFDDLTMLALEIKSRSQKEG